MRIQMLCTPQPQPQPQESFAHQLFIHSIKFNSGNSHEFAITCVTGFRRIGVEFLNLNKNELFKVLPELNETTQHRMD